MEKSNPKKNYCHEIKKKNFEIDFEDQILEDYVKQKERGKNRRANKYKDKEKEKYNKYNEWN